ncbi:hypothetical protein ES708_09142 [subsurface metagenome]
MKNNTIKNIDPGKGNRIVGVSECLSEDVLELMIIDGNILLVDIEDVARISKYTWRLKHGVVKGSPNHTLGRFVLDIPKNTETSAHHINGNPLDNRRVNLAELSRPAHEIADRIMRGATKRQAKAFARVMAKIYSHSYMSGSKLHNYAATGHMPTPEEQVKIKWAWTDGAYKELEACGII